MSTALILRQLPSPTGMVTIRQRPSDGYICVTDICQAVGKELYDWRRLDRTEEYLQELSRRIGIPKDLLLFTITIGPNDQRSTWGHPYLAFQIAQWCSLRFTVQVDTWMEAMMTATIRQPSFGGYPMPRSMDEFFQVYLALCEEERARPSTKIYTLYLIHSPHTASVKIGISSQVSRRIQALARAHGEPLTLLDIRRLPTKSLATRCEAALHTYWKALRHQGEWFAIPEGMSLDRMIQRSRRCVDRLLAANAAESQASLPFVETLQAEGFGRKSLPETRPEEKPTDAA